MKIALFGNYIFAKVAADMLAGKYELLCFCNNISDDNKFGGGIQEYLCTNRMKAIIGTKEQHMKCLEEFNPDYILSVAYKNMIPVDKLSVNAYGIHLGGIYGDEAIRGKNSLLWYKLRNIKNAKVTLYRYTTNDIDVGDVIKEVNFPISMDQNTNNNLQVECIKALVDFLLDKNFLFPDLNNAVTELQIGSYYPKAVKNINGLYLSKKELNLLKRAGINNYGGKSFTEQRINICNGTETVFHYCSGAESDKTVLFLHGFASSVPNEKIKKLSCLLDGISVDAPLVKGINRIYCDGMQNYEDVRNQFRILIKNYDLRKTVIVCSSVSSLLLCDHLRELLDVKAIIFVTPIFNLFETAFDDKLKEVVRSGMKEDRLECSNTYYSGCSISREFLEKLKDIDLLESIKDITDIKNKMYFIFAKDDINVEAEKWRKKCVNEKIPLNNVNIIDGGHSFTDIQQLYYLACCIRKILK